VEGYYEEFLVEAKYTDKQRYGLTKQAFEKIHKEAVEAGKTAAFLVDIDGLEVVALRKADFEWLVGRGLPDD
jgi:hypothetical protein